MNEFDWLSIRIPYGQPIKFIEDSLPRLLVLVNSLQVINTSICDMNIALNGLFLREVTNPEHPFMAMLISYHALEAPASLILDNEQHTTFEKFSTYLRRE